jgi:alkylation response protein AidB-like acyl-CoA dehydrogenase
MDLSLTESQVILQRTIREFLSREFTGQMARDLISSPEGLDRNLWQRMADLGWLGLPFPSDYEGSGGNFVDVALLMEEFGRVAFLSPYLATVVLGGLPILWAGNEEQRRKMLPQIASGNLLCTLALLEPGAVYGIDGLKATAEPVGDTWRLSGTKVFVDYANVADILLWPARTPSLDDPASVSIFMIPTKTKGMTITPLKTIGGDKQCEVTLDRTIIPKQSVLGILGQGWTTIKRTLEVATALLCAESVGIAQTALDMSIKHVTQRVQFGRALGQFQAVKHHCANMAMQVEGSRLLTHEAISLLSEDVSSTQQVSVAKAFTSEACREVTLTAHQLHGGVGYIVEHDLYLYSQRAKAIELRLGTPREHLQTTADCIGLGT